MSTLFPGRQKRVNGRPWSVHSRALDAYTPQVLQTVTTPPQGLFDAYHLMSGAYDEMIAQDGAARAHTRSVHALLAGLSPREFARHQALAELSLYNQGVTFSVYSDKHAGTERIFPICLVPRVIGAAEWARLERGLVQRIAA